MTIKTSRKRSIYEKLSLEGIADLLLETNPFPLNFIAFPYNLVRYGNILKKSYTLDDIYSKHSYEATKSLTFAIISPNFEKVAKILIRRYEILGSNEFHEKFRF